MLAGNVIETAAHPIMRVNYLVAQDARIIHTGSIEDIVHVTDVLNRDRRMKVADEAFPAIENPQAQWNCWTQTINGVIIAAEKTTPTHIIRAINSSTTIFIAIAATKVDVIEKIGKRL